MYDEEKKQDGQDYLQPTYAQMSNGESGYGQPTGNRVPYNQVNSGAELEVPVTMGEWLVSFLLLMIPCANIILMFVWAFSKTEKKSKSNLFKAALIFTAVYTVLTIILTAVFGAAIFAIFSSTSSSLYY